MKRGYYFCDHCDENAFGEFCRGCHQRARFVPAGESRPVSYVRRELRKMPDATVRAAGLNAFAEMRRLIAEAPDLIQP